MQCITKFVILDFPEIFYSEYQYRRYIHFDDKNNTSDFHYTELTRLGKVRQNKPLGIISYSTVSNNSIAVSYLLQAISS